MSKNLAEKYTLWLKKQGYTHIKILPEDKYIALADYPLTTNIVKGSVGNYHNYDERWCYGNTRKAIEAIKNWDGQGQPEGWDKHRSFLGT